ncbi:hypothetical protein HG530_000803 [Fusarium avenaceum]|nr:hypothetical protein HG530_000803 [Fusarium avenaceum]
MHSEGQTSSTHVKVLKTKLLKGVVKGTGNLLGAVLVVPELSSDEDVLTLEAIDLADSLLDTLTNLTLVLVDLGEIEVAVAGLEGLVDTVANLAGGSLPGAVADLGDLVARVEGDCSTERHDCASPNVLLYLSPTGNWAIDIDINTRGKKEPHV